jgi:hypothetical protein
MDAGIDTGLPRGYGRHSQPLQTSRRPSNGRSGPPWCVGDGFRASAATRAQDSEVPSRPAAAGMLACHGPLQRLLDLTLGYGALLASCDSGVDFIVPRFRPAKICVATTKARWAFATSSASSVKSSPTKTKGSPAGVRKRRSARCKNPPRTGRLRKIATVKSAGSFAASQAPTRSFGTSSRSRAFVRPEATTGSMVHV